MKLTEVTEEYLDEYLNAEGRDKLKIKHLFENAVNYVMVVDVYKRQQIMHYVKTA